MRLSHNTDTNTAFLTGGGATAALIARHDWSGSLGPVESWPQSLKTTVGLMLHSPVPLVLLWGADGIMIYNDGYSVFAGGRHPRLLGSKVLEGWPEAADLNALVMKTGLAGDTLSYKDRELSLNRRGTLEPCWVDLDYSPVIDESGAPGGVIAVVVETTDRVQAERAAQAESEALRASQQRLQMALSAGHGIGTWDWDIKNDRVFADERFAGLYGVDPQRARRGAPIQEFFANIHADDRPGIEARVAEALRTGEDFAEEYRLVQADGSVRWVVAQGRCNLAGDGTPLHFPGVSFDITTQKLAEAQLRASETQFRTMAQAAPNHVWTARPGRHARLVQSARFMATARPPNPERLDGTEMDVSIVHPDDVTSRRPPPHGPTALATGTSLTKPNSGCAAPTASSGAGTSPAPYPSGACRRRPWCGWIGTNTDIEDHKQAVQKRYASSMPIWNGRSRNAPLARGKVWQLSPDIMGVANADGFFESTNPAWADDHWAWSSEEIARNAPARSHPSRRPGGDHGGAVGIDPWRSGAAFRESLSVQGWRLPLAVLGRGAGRRQILLQRPRYFRPERKRKAQLAADRGSPAPGAEDGSGGPAHRGHRP